MNKRDMIELAFCNDLNLSTSTVIGKIRVEYGEDVSPRHVQRVRKAMLEEKNVKGNDMGKPMDDNDVFDSAHGLSSWQLDLINMINEPSKDDEFWTIQELAIIVEKTDNEVRDTLQKFNFMIMNAVLDEEKKTNVIQLPEKNEKHGGPEVNKSASNDDYWEVKIDCVTACSKVEKEINAFISRNARKKAMLYMKWAKRREWLGYLVGEKKDDGYHIYDIHLPDQRTSSTLVDKVNTNDYNQLKIVGVIHSHHEMGAGDADKPSFSGHDAEFINSNHNLSLLAGVDRKSGGFKIVGIARVFTPCGSAMKIKASVKAMKEKMSDEDQQLFDEFKSKTLGEPNAGLAGKKEELAKGQRQFVDHRYFKGQQHQHGRKF